MRGHECRKPQLIGDGGKPARPQATGVQCRQVEPPGKRRHKLVGDVLAVRVVASDDKTICGIEGRGHKAIVVAVKDRDHPGTRSVHLGHDPARTAVDV